ncbi:META domain-containing protein [Coprobacter tertius]|uniref:META domain-containing protein n=1 Tax=Coprobacter tertius TaxID=2944915 RepID=A0ABT1MHQ3_9BACT|nr:META domain-containing protein [Coprobacter tertius]MCP9612162.1 META domain-containing protein [Coprobacter tertius]
MNAKFFIGVSFIMTLTMVGCKSVEEPALTIGEWQVKEFVYDHDTIPLPERSATIQFTDTNTIFGAAGCNRYFGNYDVGDDTISISPLGRTMMFCPDMPFEDKFVKALEETRIYSIKDSILILADKNKNFIIKMKLKGDNPLIGVDLDSHDCNSAAGYTWSNLKGDCIRIFEDGIRMNSVTDKNSTTSAFIIFSADSAQVELFLPDDGRRPLLDRRKLSSGGYSWNEEDDDTYNVREKDGRWIIEQRGIELYRSEK